MPWSWWGCTRPEPSDLGRSDTAAPIELDDRSWRAPAVAQWTGDHADDQAGTEVCADDFDGDGRLEVIVGAPNQFQYGADPEPPSYVARVPLDARSGPIGARAAGRIGGARNGDNFGFRVVCPGDLTGDGASDVVVSGELSEEPPSFVGVYPAPPPEPANASDDAWATIVTGDFHEQALIENAFPCGDLDLDGISELCAATYNAPVADLDPNDKVVAFRGPIAPGRLRSPEEATWVWSGHLATTHGFRTTGGVDLGGGPIPEIAVGVSEVSGNDGGVYVLTDPVPGLSTLEAAPFWAGEVGVGGNAGAGTTVGGDVDGDGREDLCRRAGRARVRPHRRHRGRAAGRRAHPVPGHLRVRLARLGSGHGRHRRRRARRPRRRHPS